MQSSSRLLGNRPTNPIPASLGSLVAGVFGSPNFLPSEVMVRSEQWWRRLPADQQQSGKTVRECCPSQSRWASDHDQRVVRISACRCMSRQPIDCPSPSFEHMQNRWLTRIRHLNHRQRQPSNPRSAARLRVEDRNHPKSADSFTDKVRGRTVSAWDRSN
jgi:hypothetical protein